MNACYGAPNDEQAGHMDHGCPKRAPARNNDPSAQMRIVASTRPAGIGRRSWTVPNVAPPSDHFRWLPRHGW